MLYRKNNKTCSLSVISVVDGLGYVASQAEGHDWNYFSDKSWQKSVGCDDGDISLVLSLSKMNHPVRLIWLYTNDRPTHISLLNRGHVLVAFQPGHYGSSCGSKFEVTDTFTSQWGVTVRLFRTRSSPPRCALKYFHTKYRLERLSERNQYLHRSSKGFKKDQRTQERFHFCKLWSRQRYRATFHLFRSTSVRC